MPIIPPRQPWNAPSWSERIPHDEWTLYRSVLVRVLDEQVPFALGGGFAYSFHSHRWRDTKDIDLYILPRDRERTIEIVSRAGFQDLYDQRPYDRSWIYRGVREGVITDIIWAMANQRAQVDERWLTEGPLIDLRGVEMRILPAEELIWAKLYVLQRERCDWPDLLNILYVRGPALNWQHLVDRVAGDVRVLGGVLNVFAWMCPDRAAQLPAWIWEPLGMTPPESGPECGAGHGRVALLDSRDWFGPRYVEDQECSSGR